jgi:uncharacterized membrane protein
MRTRASLGGHPLHAMLVHFPLAFLIGAFAFDLFAVMAGGLAYQATARVLLAAGVITGVVAALPGIVDLLTSVP